MIALTLEEIGFLLEALAWQAEWRRDVPFFYPVRGERITSVLRAEQRRLEQAMEGGETMAAAKKKVVAKSSKPVGKKVKGKK